MKKFIIKNLTPTLTLPHGGGKNCLMSIANLAIRERAKGFTLAEVLITLGVIGVVAAITLPTLINNIQEKHFIAAWKKSFAEISNASLRLKNDDISFNGMSDLDMINNLAKYIKHTKICDAKQFVSAGCAPQNYSTYKYPGKIVHVNMGELGGGAACMLTNRGTIICVDGENVIVDVNGYKKPNTIGKDIFYAILNSNTMNVRPAIGHRAHYGATDGIIYGGIVTNGNGTCQEIDMGYGCSAEKLLK